MIPPRPGRHLPVVQPPPPPPRSNRPANGGSHVEAVADRPFHMLAKPTGGSCNLDCTYCFYLEKEKLYPSDKPLRMSDEVLEAYIQKYAASQPGRDVVFAWQGGEPTLMGLDFFEKAVRLQRKLISQAKRVSNTLQTNGVLIDREWARFLAREHFLVGVSIDGPSELHDSYRQNKAGAPTFGGVMRAMDLLKEEAVPFNTLTVVSHRNSKHPLEVYRFLREHGSPHMQFIPLVERYAGAGTPLGLAGPPPLDDGDTAQVTDWSVRPLDYGSFLCRVFDEWRAQDVGRVFVQNFETFVGLFLGAPSNSCVFAPTCGGAVVLEHNGDVYSCDHYVYPEHLLGNILDDSLAALVNGPEQTRFGYDKYRSLPAYCRSCEFVTKCYGECPKHRFARTPTGEPGLNYLCEAYKLFFSHAKDALTAFADGYRKQLTAAPPTADLGDR